MRKILIFTVIISFLSVLFSQEKMPEDTIKRTFGGLTLKKENGHTWGVYDPERGFFQKAYTDKNDPRFMITNENESFTFGIGGFVHVIGMIDFNGMVNNEDFVTSQILVPHEKSDGQFALYANNSRINFKAIGKSKHGNIIAFIETDFRGANNTLLIRHAYISYFGFTIGQTWSTFMDLEAGPPTIDQEGPNTQIAIRQPMIRYSCNFTPKLSFSIAAEMNKPQMYDYSSIGIETEFQKIPNFPVQLKYKDDFGHVQLGAILRVMNYDDDTISFKSIQTVGYGVSLSGKFNLGKKNFLYFQGVYGDGIAQYIQDLGFGKFDLAIDYSRPGRLQTLPTFGGYLSYQRDWTKSLYSAIMYGFTMLQAPVDYNFPWMFKFTHYFAVNLFWEFIPYGTIGIEYLFGQRTNQDNQYGIANRIDFMVRYGF